jgi:arginine utilization protein RocB
VNYASFAGDPERLREALISRLRVSAADPEALAGLESGEFLPGRGILDMKSGLAAGISAVFRHAVDESPAGNLLLVATADEETDSRGMRAASGHLRALAANWNVELVAGVNLDATSDDGDGRAGRSVALGSPGKLLLSAYVLGDAVHGCYPLTGISGGYIAAELARAIEGVPTLAGDGSPDGPPPPVLLALSDLKPATTLRHPAGCGVSGM